MIDDHDNPLESLRRSVDDDSAMAPRAADRLEASLRVAHAETTRRPPLWRRPALVAPLGIILLVALTFAVVVRDETPSAALVITDAENVTVVLPDGTVVTDPADGFELPDGAVVEIGPGGMATIDDVILDTPAILAVRDGRLVADVAATTTAPDRPDHLEPVPSTTAPPADVVTTTQPPATTTTTTAPAEPEPNDTAAIDDRTDGTSTTIGNDDRTADDRAEQDRSRDDERDRDTDSTDDPAPPADEPTIGISLDLRPIDAGIDVSWEVTGLQPGWSIVIARTVGDGDRTIIVTTTDPRGSLVDQPTRDDGRPVERRLRYRLLVLDEAGGEVASGPRQSLR